MRPTASDGQMNDTKHFLRTSFGQCPKCRNASSVALAGGICLRCAAEHILALELDDSAILAAATKSSAPALVPAAALPMPDRVGPYDLIEEIGHGGMGRVFAARQAGLGRIVALKVMGFGAGSVPAELELRFFREAQTAARLRHPGIVSVHDFGRADGLVYFSMDYVEGGDLAQRLRERPLAPWEAASLMRKLAQALAYAHAENVLHRDLKPSNILMDGDEPRLADFGLAAQLEAGGDLTRISAVIGTPHYLAPEALRHGSGALSVASDLYALGVILFELLTGRTPFAGATPATLPALVAASEPPSPRLLAPAVPRDLETICLKCLEREPARRYPSAAALAEDVRRFLDGEPIVARPAGAAERLVRWCRRRPALAGVWVLMAALAIGSTGAAFWIRSERVRAEAALDRTVLAESAGRERLREARVAEAKAVRRNTVPGRRGQALAALTEAMQIRPDPGLRDEALGALLLPDLERTGQWTPPLERHAQFVPAPTGDVVATEVRRNDGFSREPAVLWHWGANQPFGRISTAGADMVGSLVFSPDGALLMGRLDDATLRLWRTGETNPTVTLDHRPLPGGGILVEGFNTDYDFSPDGGHFALGVSPRGLSVHRTADGGEVRRWEGGHLFNRVAWSPDGRHLAAARTSRTEVREISLLRASDLTLVHALELTAAVNALAWSVDGRGLAATLTDNTLVFFDVETGRTVDRFALTIRDPSELTWLGGDQFVAVSGGFGRVALIHAATGREEVLLGDCSPASLRAAAPRGGGDEFRLSSLQNVMTRWQVRAPVGWRPLAPGRPNGYSDAFGNGCLDFTPDGRRAFSGHGRYVIVRDTATGRLLGELELPDRKAMDLSSVAVADGGQTLLHCSTLGGLTAVPVADTADGQVRFRPPVALDPEPGFAITDHTADGRRVVLVNNETGTLKFLAVNGSTVRRLARWSADGLYSAAVSPDGETLLATCGGAGENPAAQRVRVHRADGSVVRELAGDAAGEAAWSAAGRWALTSNGPTGSTLWDTRDWRAVAHLTGGLAGNATTFALAPDGSLAVIASQTGIHLVSTADGSRLASFEIPGVSGLVAAVRFLPGSQRVGVLWRDGRLDLFDVAALRAGLAPLGLAW